MLRGREHFIHWYTVHLRPRAGSPPCDRSPTASARGPTDVHIQDLGFRWGSADRRGHLYFHWRVALLPPEMLRYLVAHELVHLRERSHTAAFWARLARVVPDYKARRQWLADEGGAYDL